MQIIVAGVRVNINIKLLMIQSPAKMPKYWIRSTSDTRLLNIAEAVVRLVTKTERDA